MKFVVFYVGTNDNGTSFGRVDVTVDSDIDTMNKISEIEDSIKNKFNLSSCIIQNWKSLKN